MCNHRVIYGLHEYEWNMFVLQFHQPDHVDMFQGVLVCLYTNVAMQRGDYTGPLVSMEISGIFTQQQKDKLTPKMLDFFIEVMGIQDDR